MKQYETMWNNVEQRRTMWHNVERSGTIVALTTTYQYSRLCVWVSVYCVLVQTPEFLLLYCTIAYVLKLNFLRPRGS